MKKKKKPNPLDVMIKFLDSEIELNKTYIKYLKRK